jgi:hypothetical protein
MENEKLQLVTFKQAKKLNEIGYNWGTYAPSYWYKKTGELSDSPFYPFDIYYTALSVALALKWFNDVKKIPNGTGGVIDAYEPLPHPYYWTEYYWGKYWIKGDEITLKHFQTRDMAEEALLDKLLKHYIKNKIMELNEFIEKFLPDYWYKVVHLGDTMVGWESRFVEKHFSDALENFANMICKKQREYCSDDIYNRCYELGGITGITLDVENCKQPKIDEL